MASTNVIQVTDQTFAAEIEGAKGLALVDFWAVWCGPCVAELPNVLKAYEAHHAKGFEIIGISLDQDEKKLRAFMEEKKMTWVQNFDGKGWGNKLAPKYGVNSIPAPARACHAHADARQCRAGPFPLSAAASAAAS